MKLCWNIKADLSAYVDAELPVTRRAEVEAHLTGCAGCRQHVAELQRLAAGVAALPRAAEPAGVLVEVRRRLQATPASSVRWGLPAWGAAVAALVVVGVTVFWLSDRQPVKTTTTVAKLERERRVEIVPAEEAAVAKLTAPSVELPAKDRGALAAADLEMPTPSAATVAWAEPKMAMDKKIVLPSPEVITVVDNDARQVQEEARLILAGLQGRVETVAATSFKVSLPASNVAQFKARLALREAGRKEMQDLAQVGGDKVATAKREMLHSANVPKAVEMTLSAARDSKVDTVAVGGAGASAVATQEMVVLEIRVQPAGQR